MTKTLSLSSTTGEVQVVTLQRGEYLQQFLHLQVVVRTVTSQRDEFFRAAQVATTV
jgi:hypothetical protein